MIRNARQTIAAEFDARAPLVILLAIVDAVCVGFAIAAAL